MDVQNIDIVKLSIHFEFYLDSKQNLLHLEVIYEMLKLHRITI